MNRFPLVAALAALCFALVLAALPAQSAEPVSFAALSHRALVAVAAAPVAPVSFAAIDHRTPVPVAAKPVAAPAVKAVPSAAVPATTSAGGYVLQQQCGKNGCRWVRVPR